MKFALFEDTRVGKRPYNQDRVGHWKTGEALLLVVADGMGGHAHGEVAAQITVDCFGAAFRAEAKPRLADPDAFLARGVTRAHAMILHQTRKQALAQSAADSPRTTVVACLIQQGYAYWSFIGDSRLYLIRDGRIVTRTRDHTPVQALVDSGRIREEAAMMHPDKNKLLQCLGGPRAPQVEPPARARLLKNDLLLLCSDGFWGPLMQRQLLMGLIGKPPAKALPELVALSETRAGPRCDNISVLALEWLDKAVAPPVEPATVLADATTEFKDFTATAPDFMHITDAEIDRAIEDIKKALALKKNQERK
jgi:serine/threonine protein phosphatase PrpC